MCNCGKNSKSLVITEDHKILSIKNDLMYKYNSMYDDNIISNIFLPSKEIMDIVETILKTEDIIILRLLITNLENITGIKLLS